MLRRLLHWIVSKGRVHNWVQYAVGADYVFRRVTTHLRAAPIGRPILLDVGGGGGLIASYLPPSYRYACLDLDRRRLSHSRVGRATEGFICGDAASLPIATASVDAVACTAVLHHMPDQLVSSLMEECARVIKPGGQFVFLDPIWRPDRPWARLLWRYDQGSHPRAAQTLEAIVRGHFGIILTERFTVIHEYFLAIGSPVMISGTGRPGMHAEAD